MSQPQAKPGPTLPRYKTRAEDLPLRRKAYGLILLALAGGFLVGLLAERHGDTHWPMILGSLLVGVTGLILLAQRWILQPIDGLLRGIEIMRRTDRPPEPGRLPIHRGDEIGQVAQALQDLAIADHRDRSEVNRLRRTLDANVAHATRAATAHLRLQALRDPLTDLGNRRFMDEHVPALFHLARDRGQQITCMVIDLDDFKRINDELGHAAGDAVLKRLADLLRACLREQDLAIRLGGDEFALWLPGMTLTRAAALGDSLRKLFKQQMSVMGEAAADAGLSIGLASTAQDRADTPDELLALADSRLYAIKHGGKGRVYGVEAVSA